jgi:hypothetical protein
LSHRCTPPRRRGARSRGTPLPGVFSPCAQAPRRIAAPAAAGRDAAEEQRRAARGAPLAHPDAGGQFRRQRRRPRPLFVRSRSVRAATSPGRRRAACTPVRCSCAEAMTSGWPRPVESGGHNALRAARCRRPFRRPPPGVRRRDRRRAHGMRGARGTAYMMGKAQAAMAAAKMAARDRRSGGGRPGSLWTSAWRSARSRAGGSPVIASARSAASAIGAAAGVELNNKEHRDSHVARPRVRARFFPWHENTTSPSRPSAMPSKIWPPYPNRKRRGAPFSTVSPRRCSLIVPTAPGAR